MPWTVAFVASFAVFAPQDPGVLGWVEQLVAEAEKARAAGAAEQAVVALWRARSLLVDAPSSPPATAAAKSVAAALAAADPEAEAFARLDADAAKRFGELARGYRARKWANTAVVVARDLALHDRDAGVRELEASVKAGGVARPAATAEPSSETAIDLLRPDPQLLEGEWRREPGVLLSPSPQSSTQSSVFVSSTKQGDGQLGVTVDLGGGDASAALIFGGEGEDYYLCELHAYEGQRSIGVVLHRWSARKLERLRDVDAQTSGPRGVIRLEIGIRGDQLSVRVDDHPVFDARTPTVPHGAIGFHVTSASTFRGPVRFSDLTIEAIDKPDGAEARAADATARWRRQVGAAITAAGKQAAKRQGEAAVEALRGLLDRLGRVEPAELRMELVAEVQKAAVRIDPLWPRWQQARVETAKALAEQAERYLQRGWRDATAIVYARAAALDAAHAAAAAEAEAARPRPGR